MSMTVSGPAYLPAPVAQLDRAFASEAEGHRFESCRVHHAPGGSTLVDSSERRAHAAVAQLVEHRLGKAEVTGSSPVSSFFGEWRSLVAHLSGGQVVAGSNPVSPTIPSRCSSVAEHLAHTQCVGGSSPPIATSTTA